MDLGALKKHGKNVREKLKLYSPARARGNSSPLHFFHFREATCLLSPELPCQKEGKFPQVTCCVCNLSLVQLCMKWQNLQYIALRTVSDVREAPVRAAISIVLQSIWQILPKWICRSFGVEQKFWQVFSKYFLVGQIFQSTAEVLPSAEFSAFYCSNCWR